MSVIL